MSAHAYLRIGSVEGGSTDRHHEGWIEVRSFTWSETSGAGAGGHAAVSGRVTASPLVVTADVSVASPRLMVACARNERFDVAELEVVQAGENGGRPFLRWRLQDVVVSGYAVTAEDFLPVDTITLRFESLRFDVVPQQPDGSPGSAVTGEVDFTRPSR
ncbi:Hcp family type VI secretion system effector [Cellulomonas fimi]|uniref:Hcp family type VI secretion system effector n=1 Tax=Cellulomonas fimi TaxID=1708 RepID=UPI0023594DAB|nr:type VI secretion system tube protein Hcp [Cellulomonas fimi]